MARMRVLTELSSQEKTGLLAMICRAVNETSKGLDVVTPQYALIVSHDEIPLIISNCQTSEQLLEWARTIERSIVNGAKVAPISVPKRMTPRQGFLDVMVRSRGKTPVSPDELHCMSKSYMCGYLEAMVQYAGMRAAIQVGRDHVYMSEKGWMPGEEWHYWAHNPELIDQSGG